MGSVRVHPGVQPVPLLRLLLLLMLVLLLVQMLLLVRRGSPTRLYTRVAGI